jgi:hypothetical protein
VREWCGEEAVEEFNQVLALREEVDRLQALVEDTVRWLHFSGHPVKAALLAKELNKASEPEIRTYDDYEYIVRCHVVPSLGRLKLKDLTAAHVQALYRKKLDSGLSNETVLHIHRTLRRALNQATRWRLRASANRRVTYVAKSDEKAVEPLWELPSMKSCQPIGGSSYTLQPGRGHRSSPEGKA